MNTKGFNLIFFSLIFIVGAFLIPDCFVSRHVTTGVFGIAILVILYSIISVRKFGEIKITPLLLLVLLFSVHWLAHQFLDTALSWHDWIEYSSFLLFFFIFSQQEFNEKDLKQYYFIGSVVGAVMGVWGVLQNIGLVQAYYTLVPVCGSFDNPAGLAIFLSAFLPFSLYFTRDRDARYKGWGIITALLTISVILLSHSRTGTLIVFILCILYFNLHMPFSSRNRFWNKYILSLVVLLLFVALYFWKKNSADGRMLIWLCSLDMFFDHWFWGVGGGKFQSEYMLYQADFFQCYPDSMFAMLADNVKHPFNEYVKVLVEYGILGFILIFMSFIDLVRVCIFHRNKSFLFPVFGSILAIALGGCFSYPLSYPAIALVLVLNVAILNTYHFIEWKIKGKFGRKVSGDVILLFSMLLFGVVGYCGYLEFEWNRVAKISLTSKGVDILPRYQKIYEVMKNDGLFLYNYSAILYQENRYDKSLEILKECCLLFNDEDVQQLLAKNYIQLQMYSEAKNCLLLAAAMCPVRFVPLYELMNLHVKTQDIEEAKRYARIIINKPVKINSYQVMKIKNAAKMLLKQYPDTNRQ